MSQSLGKHEVPHRDGPQLRSSVLTRGTVIIIACLMPFTMAILWQWERGFAIADHSTPDVVASVQNQARTPDTPSTAQGGEVADGERLYAKHCEVCHGVAGDGLGKAARYLFPRPRDFSAGGLPLASTENGIASLEDIEWVLAKGMPGTSMRAFDTLKPAERRLLAQEVLRLRREGTRRQVTRAMLQAGEEPVEMEVNEAVEQMTTPGRPVALPQHWASDEAAIARGKIAYRTLGCEKCHGEDGMGAADQALFDSAGEPNRPRDLVHEPFKGGRTREAIYLRIVVGMPGTAHPAAPGLPEDELKDLVAFILSLARPPERLLTNHDRREYAEVHAYRRRFVQ